MHLDIDSQIQVKKRILLESLSRGGHLDFAGPIIVHSARESGYRIRSRFHVQYGQRRLAVGFKERGSHRLVDIVRCLQISSKANRVLELTREWIAAREARSREIVTFEILESNAGSTSGEQGRLSLHFVVKGHIRLSRRELEELAEKACLQGVVVTAEGGRGKDWRFQVGESGIVQRVGDIDYRTRPGSFFQVNQYLVESLVSETAYSKNTEDGLVVDLYCGVGLFTLPLAKLARRVLGVESSSSAIVDARANALGAGVDNVEFIECTAGEYSERSGFAGADVVVADPPRGGLAPAVVQALTEHPPKELRYVSCDAPALGRDAGQLARAGFTLERLVLLDLFPNTHHFETVAIFRLLAP
jgi:23S rRNA (uracil1939-C5)-methyltransferase